MRNHRALYAGLVLAGLALLTLTIGEALADPILVHSSREDFYSTGGTMVTGCWGEGCPSANFSIGDTSGTVLWEIVEKVFVDGSNKIWSYTLFNDTLTAGVGKFQIASGVFGTGTAPDGWTFTQDGNYWTFTGDTALGATNSMGGFSVVTSTAYGVGFNLTQIELGDGSGMSSEQWMASAPVPEPASLLLMGSGLAGFGAWRRRRDQHA